MPPHLGQAKRAKAAASKQKRMERKRLREMYQDDDVVEKKAHGVFVIRRGQVEPGLKSLVQDLRFVMSPHTSRKLKEKMTNYMKDFVGVASQLNVTHMIAVSQSKSTQRTHLRLLRFPRGPTLTFRVLSYSLQADVRSVSKHPRANGSEYEFSPLLVLNRFAEMPSPAKELVVETLQQTFQPLNVHALKLSHCRRVVIFDYNAETNTIDFRHFLITVKQQASGSAIVQSMLKSKRALNLHNLKDVSELFDPLTNIDIDFNVDEEGDPNSQRSICLVEVGPRMQLQLYKIEDGFAGGETLYHSTVVKTDEELQSLRLKQRAKVELKARRKKEQEDNVQAKQAKKKAQAKSQRGEDGEDGEEESNREHKSRYSKPKRTFYPKRAEAKHAKKGGARSSSSSASSSASSSSRSFAKGKKSSDRPTKRPRR